MAATTTTGTVPVGPTIASTALTVTTNNCITSNRSSIIAMEDINKCGVVLNKKEQSKFVNYKLPKKSLSLPPHITKANIKSGNIVFNERTSNTSFNKVQIRLGYD